MNYLTYMSQIERVQNRHARTEPNYLVSGCDFSVHQVIFNYIIESVATDNRPIIIIGDMDRMLNLNALQHNGYQIGTWSGCNPLNNDTFRLRELLSIIGYSEQQIGTVFTYLNFVKYLETLSQTNNRSVRLSMDLLGKYSSTLLVELKLEELRNTGRISDAQRLHLLSKYSEVASAAADFEQILYLFAPYLLQSHGTQLHPRMALRLSLENNEILRRIQLQMVNYIFADAQTKPTVLIVDKGDGRCGCFCEFLAKLPSDADVHFFTNDVFTLAENQTELNAFIGRFSAKFFTRHNTMDSCAKVETEAGDIFVERTTYTETYDRRWGVNRPIDMLWRRNKTEAFAHTPRVLEPKYKKEFIQRLQSGCAICCYMGNTELLRVSA